MVALSRKGRGRKKLEAPPPPAATQFQPFANPRARLFAYAAVFLISFALRVASSGPHFFASNDPGYRNFEFYDSNYQARRTEMIVRNFPHVPFYDTYDYYPDNLRVPWPMGYNLLIATIVKPFDLLFHSRPLNETVLGLIPCVVDSATQLLFLYLFASLLPFVTALIAALFSSLSFVNIEYAEVGYIDHHYFITFMTAVTALLLYWYERSPSRLRALLLGFAIGAAVFFNVSTIQYSLFFLLVLLLLGLRKNAPPDFVKHSYWTYGSAFLFALLSGFSTPAGRLMQIRYDETLMFQPLLILFSGLGAAFILQRKRPIVALSLVIVGLAVAALLWRNILEGARFLMFGNVLNGSQGEEASILKYGPVWYYIFTWGALLVPFGIVSFWKRRRAQTFLWPLLAVFFTYGVITGLSHLGYVQFAHPWYSIVVAQGLVAVASVKRWAIYAFFFLQPLWVTGSFTCNLSGVKTETRETMGQTIEAFAWMRENTPPTAHHELGDGPPEYSVFARRDYGHLLVRHAHRPAVVSPFSTPAFLGHMVDYARYAFSDTENEVLPILDRYRSRYVVIDNTDNTLHDFYLKVLRAVSPQEFSKYRPAAAPTRWPFLFRNSLLFFDGHRSGKESHPPEHLRLIYETVWTNPLPFRTPIGTHPAMKIYERVAGAHVIMGGLTPGNAAELQIPVKTNRDRTFQYRQERTADTTGHLQWVIPYTSDGVGVALLVNGKKRDRWDKALIITDKDVREGRTIFY